MRGDGAGRAGPGTLDWDTAVATATRLVQPGPPGVSREVADRAVRALREYSLVAETHVRELTDLGHELPVRHGDVVDRPGWIRSAAGGLAELTDIATRHAQRDDDTDESAVTALLGGVGRQGAGLQAGVVLAYLGAKVLGQFDPFVPGPDGSADGRLVLVAPNIVAAQQALDVPADDFAMWVCLHESTHRLQFTAVPWLRDYFAASLAELMSEMDGTATELAGRLPAVVKQVRAGREGDSSPGMLGIVELVQSPRQRAAFDRIIALSTLLEGHADHVMDAVGPEVVPSVRTIRDRFTRRRQGGGLLDRVLRSLLGVDAKIKQYAQGAAFTDRVVDVVGMEGFNAVWTAPENLPSRAEITSPDSWVRRVHG
ncbi:coenzyme F420 biosynthesis-associated protein [Allosaccharopolyspora coralli]|uniref:Coenzyme F420 biosynthesis-associated protein n=1 Tax=Allosaccharopolyspora coralli TaxID=2665642 RepID=A0A5Q3QBN7_9PSEU|nr:zinc-dependent metalloprotease [Allosaccharopolyspora coralli]QGK71968.1 coenzyme F420 biosynthesis-associated protein [Allosaccharopolyspora coralli]